MTDEVKVTELKEKMKTAIKAVNSNRIAGRIISSMKINRYILISFCTSLGIMLLVAFCYDMVPFGDITILRMDMYHQYGPLLAELCDRIKNFDSLLYSWQSGGGGSFFGNFANYLSSPLSFLIILFGHRNTTEFIAFLITAKVALSAASMTWYFKESPQFKISNFFTAGFGILYAFSGYFIAYYWNFMWLDGMVLLPLIILGVEKIFDGQKSLFYMASLTLLMFASYYMAYMVCIFIVLYTLMYIAATQKLCKKMFWNLGRLFGYSMISAGLAAASLLPTWYCLKSCSATSDSFPDSFETYFNIFDFLCQHLSGIEPTIRSSGGDVLPNIFCGILTVMLALLFLYEKSIPIREKVACYVLLLILALSIDLNYVNFIWHAFHFPNDLPYRWSYCYSFLLITIAAKALFRIPELKSNEIINIGIGLALFIVIAEETGSKNVKFETVIISLAYVIIYTVILRLIQNSRFRTTAMAGLVFCIIFSEIAIANTGSFDIDQPKTNYAGDYNDFKTLQAKLDERENGAFYRMELTDLRTRMDPSWYGYNGLSTFSSMAYEKASNLQQDLGMFGNYINSYTYKPQTPVYNALFSLKYVVNNSYAIDLEDRFYEEIATVDKFTAYENRYCLPLGFCVSENVTDYGSGNTNPFINQSNLWRALTGLDDVFVPVPVTDCSYFNVEEFDELSGPGYVFHKINHDESASFTLLFTPEKEQNLYLYVKSSNTHVVTMRNTDDTFYKSMTVDEPYIYDLGVFEAEEVVYIEIPIEEGNSGYVDAYIYALDEDVFKEGYEILSKSPLEVTSMTDTRITGNVTADSDTLLFTSINYDPSWIVRVDGKPVPESSKVKIGDALLGIRLTEGPHSIDLRYVPKGMNYGILISLFSLVILFFLNDRKKVLKLKTTEDFIC